MIIVGYTHCRLHTIGTCLCMLNLRQPELWLCTVAFPGLFRGQAKAGYRRAEACTFQSLIGAKRAMVEEQEQRRQQEEDSRKQVTLPSTAPHHCPPPQRFPLTIEMLDCTVFHKLMIAVDGKHLCALHRATCSARRSWRSSRVVGAATAVCAWRPPPLQLWLGRAGQGRTLRGCRPRRKPPPRASSTAGSSRRLPRSRSDPCPWSCTGKS